MHPVLRARAESRLGLFTTSDARDAGYGPGEIRSLCATGRWVRLRRGVMVSASDLAAAEQRDDRHRLDCLAVLVALDRPSAVLSHASAARLWQVPVPRATGPTIRLTDPTQWREGRGWRMTCAPLRPAERWRTGPLRLTSPCGPWSTARASGHWRTPSRRWTQRCWPGARRCRTSGRRPQRCTTGGGRPVRPGQPPSPTGAESPLETRGRLRLVGSGLPCPELQVEIRSGGRLVGVVDAWFDEAAVAVEFDGMVKYTDPWRSGRTLWEEKRREDELRALGIRVVRIADADLGASWPTVAARLTALVRTPGPSPRPFTAIPRDHGVRRSR